MKKNKFFSVLLCFCIILPFFNNVFAVSTSVDTIQTENGTLEVQKDVDEDENKVVYTYWATDASGNRTQLSWNQVSQYIEEWNFTDGEVTWSTWTFVDENNNKLDVPYEIAGRYRSINS